MLSVPLEGFAAISAAVEECGRSGGDGSTAAIVPLGSGVLCNKLTAMPKIGVMLSVCCRKERRDVVWSSQKISVEVDCLARG